MNKQRKLNFYPEKRKDTKTGQLKTKNVPIYLFFSFDGKRFQYYTGQRIDLSKWDEENQQVKRNNINSDGRTATEINSELNKVRVYVEEIHKQYTVNKKNLTIEKLKYELNDRLYPKDDASQETFFGLFQKFIDTEKVTWRLNTVKRVTNSMNHLRKYKSGLTFDDIDETFFKKFTEYSIRTNGHKNATILKQIKNTKLFMNWATRNGYTTSTAYKDAKIKLTGVNKPNNVIFLTWTELMHLYKLKISKKYLEQVRDVFCFGCFTGLRYSDVYNLKRSNIKKDVIEITTIKTSDALKIELNDYSRAILKKYKDYDFQDNKCLPVISNQKMNDYLKELGQLAKLNEKEPIITWQGANRIEKTFFKWELLTTHVGRKTFVSNALFFNIPAEVIMAWTGHKDHKTMENYYKIIGTQKQREMSKFNI
ncbi:MAG: site-specific integrase [Bacteroidia bacterium]|nr:site-specific integrase [Bacteroidia bacterium]